MLIKENIIKNFSKYAHLYDSYSYIQKITIEELAKYLDEKIPENILEIGCGTGNYTYLLHKKFPTSKIDALDISPKMIFEAKKKINNENINFYVCDAEEFKNVFRYDLITSNMCFQWFSDLKKTLFLYKDLLKEGGYILFSMAGPDTLFELNYIFRIFFEDFKNFFASNFIDRFKIEMLMRENFRNVFVKEIIYKKTYPSLFDLFKHIIYTGTKGINLARHILTYRFLLRLQNLYENKFGGIIATYQVFFCKGYK